MFIQNIAVNLTRGYAHDPGALMVDDAWFRVFAVAFGDGDKQLETRHIKHLIPERNGDQVRDPKPNPSAMNCPTGAWLMVREL